MSIPILLKFELRDRAPLCRINTQEPEKLNQKVKEGDSELHGIMVSWHQKKKKERKKMRKL